MSVQSTGRREQRRHQLLDTALELFGEVGFERATIKALAGRAGISQGLLYHYFQSKEELIAAVMERHSLIPRLEELYASPKPLPQLAEQVFALFWEKKEICWLFFRELRNPAVAEPMDRMRRENLRLLAAYLERRVQAGEFLPHDCTMMAYTFLSALFMMSILPQEGETPAGIAEALLEGLRPR